MKNLNLLKPSNITFKCVVLGLLLLINSCDTGFFKYSSFDNAQDSINQSKIFFDNLTTLYNTEPDSALSAAMIAEIEFVEAGKNRELIRLYSFLSELYQYRIVDHAKALQYMALALEVYAQNPELEFDKTYLYINIGNILNRYQLFEEAIYIYEQIPSVCEKNLTPAINSLICNNIALSFQSLGDCNSAKSYFSKSLEYIDQTKIEKPLLTIQYYNYINSLGLDCNSVDSILICFEITEKIFRQIDRFYDNYTIDFYANCQKKSKWDYYNNKVSALDKIAKYNIIQGAFEDAQTQYNTALIYAKDEKFSMWTSYIYLSLSELARLSGEYDVSIQYVDSALFIAIENTKNLKNLRKIYDTYASIYHEHGDHLLANQFNQIAADYSDSIKLEESSKDIVLNKIELIVVPVKLAMKDVERSKMQQKRIIDKQISFISLLIVGIIFIVLVLIFYYRLYRNLKNTQKELAFRTIENFKENKFSNMLPKQLDFIESELVKKIEEEIVIAKVYLEPGISLHAVAERLDSNRSYVSALINNVYGMNFNDFINKLRIEEACKKICDNTNPNFTIDHLYSEVGFFGKSTFYKAFKKYSGVTPAIFFKLNSASINSNSSNNIPKS